MPRWLFIIVLFSLTSLAFAISLQDPTRPVMVATTNDESNDGLSAIYIKPNLRYAVLDGKIVYQDQNYNNSRVHIVDSNAVQLIGNDGKITLILFKRDFIKNLSRPISIPKG